MQALILHNRVIADDMITEVELSDDLEVIVAAENEIEGNEHLIEMDNDESFRVELENADARAGESDVQEYHIMDESDFDEDVNGGSESTEKVVIATNSNKLKLCASIDELNAMQPLLVSTDSGESLFGCPICSVVFNQKAECSDHFSDHRFDFEPQKCERCSSVFKTARFYRNHLQRMHSGETLVCHICAKEFVNNKGRFKEHVRKHDMTKRHKCSFEGCDKIFRLSQHLTIHLRSHTNEYPYLCSQCPSRFRTSYNLNVHNRRHTGELKKCSICSAEFLTNTSLKLHMLRCDGTKKAKGRGRKQQPHTSFEEKQTKSTFKCFFENCDREFASKKEIQEHLGNSHQMLVHDLMCHRCGEELESAASLRHHLRMHLGFVCPHCNIPLTSEMKLNDHVTKFHDATESRPHHCQFDGCKSRFKRSEHLKTHVKFRHSSDKPFKCDICPFASAVRYDLNHHIKTHKTGRK